MLFKKHFTKLTITYLNYTFESVCVTLHLNSYYQIKTLRPCFFFLVNQSMKTHAKNRQLIKKKSPNANKIHKGNHTLKFIIIAISCKLSKLKH